MRPSSTSRLSDGEIGVRDWRSASAMADQRSRRSQRDADVLADVGSEARIRRVGLIEAMVSLWIMLDGAVHTRDTVLNRLSRSRALRSDAMMAPESRRTSTGHSVRLEFSSRESRSRLRRRILGLGTRRAHEAVR